ncbi:MAG: Uncharacterised protein [Flavobacteriaceae bacterium]|nr:MAG: Uncharacterised protein [Flavobacteriaceae bacterium]
MSTIVIVIDITPQRINANATLLQSILDLEVVRFVILCLCKNLTAINNRNIKPPAKGNNIYKKLRLDSNNPIM